MKFLSLNKVFFLLFLIIISCTKEEVELNFENSNSSIDIIVEGGILTLKGKQYLKITKPHTPNIDSIEPIIGAEVKVFDKENIYVYEETSVQGEYESILEFSGEIGRLYTLEISYNGKTYYASDSLIEAEAISINEFPIEEIVSDNGRIYTYSSMHIFGYKNANLWIVNRYRDSLNNIILLKPKQIIKSSFVIYAHKGVLPQGLFPGGFTTIGNAGGANDTTEYFKLSLSDDYYKYLISVFNLTDWSSGIFYTIPGNTCTNLSEGGTGYFFASDVKKIRMKFKDLKEIGE